MITKKQIRCYKTLINADPGVVDFPVYYVVYEGWSNLSFATCINCGELFFVDWENPETRGLNIEEVAGFNNCPRCHSPLKATIKRYPENIKLPNGKIASYVPDPIIPPHEESLILEVFELKPEFI